MFIQKARVFTYDKQTAENPPENIRSALSLLVKNMGHSEDFSFLISVKLITATIAGSGYLF